MTDQVPLTECMLTKYELPKAFFARGGAEEHTLDSGYLIYLHIDICYRASSINDEIDDYSDFHLQVADELIRDSWGYLAHTYKDYRYRLISNFTPGKATAIKTVVEMIWPGAFKPELREQSNLHRILLPR